MARTLTLACFCAASLLAYPSQAQEAGDAQAGRTIANASCAQCHAIEAGVRSSPDAKAPAFDGLAKHAKMTTRDIEGWLTASHPGMPAVMLPAQQRADLVAYIKSLALKP